ncbi:MAG: DnaJ domain-containing protein [Desulfobacterales bacterium]
MEQKDYYKILGVNKDADIKSIKEAYRELALKYHPDRNKDNPEKVEKMKLVNEAYAVLSNSSKRKEYDNFRDRFGSDAYSRFRHSYSEQDIFSGSDIFRVFEELTKAFNLRGHDEIFKEFYGPGYRKYEYKRPGLFVRGFIFTGPFGTGKPKNKQVSGRGPLGRLSSYVFKKLTGADIPRDGADINETIDISPELAENGGPYAYFHSSKSKKLLVKIPPGVRDGQRIRLSKMGEDGKGGGKPGDLYLKVHVRKPILRKIKDFLSDLRK